MVIVGVGVGAVQSASSITKRTLAAGGFLLLTLAATAGILTASTSWASGVSVTSDAQAVANDAFTYPLTFDASIQTSIDEVQASDSSISNVTSAFYQSYTSATEEYNTALISAANVYVQNYADNPAAARDTYIDSFNNARATYFNKLEAARNALVTELSGLNDTAKDMFVNQYNAARDLYSNQLESVKNEIANL